MALVRRRFVASIVLDGVLFAFIVVSALVHSVSRGHHDDADRSAVAMFAWHAWHALIGVVGLAAIVVPVASAPPRALVWLTPVAIVADVVAASSQARQALVDAPQPNEYTVFAVLAATLAFSSTNVYWASRAEAATFVCDDDDADDDDVVFGAVRRRRV